MKKHAWFNNEWTIIGHDRTGKELWRDVGLNALADEGEEAILEVFFRNGAAYVPPTFFMRLCNATLLETSTLLTVTGEPSGFNYSPQEITRDTTGFPTKEVVGGDYRLTSLVVTFGAIGGVIGPVTTAYLATTSDNTGKLICYRSLAMTRTILDGDFMTLQIRVLLS